jgi:hypothetical protein
MTLVSLQPPKTATTIHTKHMHTTRAPSQLLPRSSLLAPQAAAPQLTQFHKSTSTPFPFNIYTQRAHLLSCCCFLLCFFPSGSRATAAAAFSNHKGNTHDMFPLVPLANMHYSCAPSQLLRLSSLLLLQAATPQLLPLCHLLLLCLLPGGLAATQLVAPAAGSQHHK